MTLRPAASTPAWCSPTPARQPARWPATPACPTSPATTATRSAPPPPVIHTITLAPGGSAAALLHETNYADFDQTVCKPVTVRGLRVYPPNATKAVFLPRVSKECSATVLPDPAVSIGVVVAGTSASA